MANRTDRPGSRPAWRSFSVVGATILALGLGACRESEQDRPLFYEPGVYKGQKDTPLTDAQLRELQHRGTAQKF